MPHLNPQRNEYLKSIWAAAYAGTTQVFDFTTENHAITRMASFRYALYNYRRRIRNHKLEPNIAEEWARLTKCEVVLLTPTLLEVRLVNKLLHKRKVEKFTYTPEIPFILPTTTII